MRQVKIVNACVRNLLIRKALIKFDVIMQVSSQMLDIEELFTPFVHLELLTACYDAIKKSA